PLIEGFRLVEALVALQPDEAGAAHLGYRLGELGLAGAGRALDEHGLLQAVGEIHDAGDAFVGEVADVLQAVPNLGPGVESVAAHGPTLPALLTEGSIRWPVRPHPRGR